MTAAQKLLHTAIKSALGVEIDFEQLPDVLASATDGLQRAQGLVQSIETRLARVEADSAETLRLTREMHAIMTAAARQVAGAVLEAPDNAGRTLAA